MKEAVTAIYLRLSDEDRRDDQDESGSIASQRELLTAYVRNHAELSDCSVIEFCDDGYSGTDFARPGVQKLLDQVKKGAVSTVIVKDLSRFGRNYIEVGNYLEQVFPFLGVRFISVNDGFDSKASAFSGDFFDTAFKNLIYDLYSKDLSRKIVSARRTKAGQGKFITAYAPYGYLKSPKQRLIPDAEAAPVVRRIFCMVSEGTSKADVAKIFNREEIPSPLMLRRRRGELFPCRTVNEKSIWRTSAISSILKDRRYAGDSVYGEGEQCILVPDTHEALVSREVFEKVNRMLRKRRTYQRNKPAPLAGIVRCAACNHRISGTKRIRSKGAASVTYRCGVQDMTEEFGCCPLAIEEKRMEHVVLTILRKTVCAIMDEELKNTLRDSERSRIGEAEKLLIMYETESARAIRLRMTKYELYKRDLLSRDAFLREKAGLDVRIDRLRSDIEKQKNILCELKRKDREGSCSALFETLTRDMTETFVEQIFICQDGTLKIKWKFHDFFGPTEKPVRGGTE